MKKRIGLILLLTSYFTHYPGEKADIAVTPLQPRIPETLRQKAIETGQALQAKKQQLIEAKHYQKKEKYFQLKKELDSHQQKAKEIKQQLRNYNIAPSRFGL